MIETVLVFIIIIALILIFAILLFIQKPYEWKKEITGDRVTFIFQAHKDIKSIELQIKQKRGEVKFGRQNIKKGEKVEFIYELSSEPAQLTIENGGKKTYEV
ncbi:MAG: hypothetical protein QXF35_03135 [Candidatus Bilamarchaeaceae archaeon]